MTLLDDKVAVVTGGGRGIGRAIALALAQAGADVVVAARTREDLEDTASDIRGHGGTALPVEVDLREGPAVARLVEQVLDAFGQVDLLVNNSGIPGPSAPVWELDETDWADTLATNVTGTMRCCQAFLPAMIERGKGAIVTIGSVSGKRPLLNRAAYATSKMALVGLTRTLALEAGPHGIRVNLVSPGAVSGERLDWVITEQARLRDVPAEQVRQELAGQSPLRRFVTPEDVAAIVVHLASDAASAVTGEDVNVAAGLVMY